MYNPQYFNLRRNWIPALIGAAGSIASGIVGGLFNNNQKSSAQRYNTSERIASQEYQTSEREAQNKWAEQQYLQYQSPKALYDQYAAAGLNPNLAAGAGQVGSPTAGSGSSGGAPSGTHISPAWQNMPSLSESIGQLAGAAQSFATAKKVGLDSKLLRETFDDLAADTKYSMHMKKFEALVGQYVRNNKDLALIKEIGQKIKNGVATEDQIRELIKGIKIKNASDRNALFKWFETYDRDARAIEAGIANTQANTNRTYVGSLLDAQKTLESQSVVKVNEQTARKLGLDSKLIEETFDDLKKQLKTNIAGMEADNRNKALQAYDDIVGIINFIETGQHEISGDNWARVQEILRHGSKRRSWIPYLIENADSIHKFREALSGEAAMAYGKSRPDTVRTNFGLEPIRR